MTQGINPQTSAVQTAYGVNTNTNTQANLFENVKTKAIEITTIVGICLSNI